MKYIRHILFLLVLLGLLSCEKKKYPESITENEPEFYFSGIVDNVPVRITAGLDNYYMYSEFFRDAGNVNAFTGQLKQTGCLDCRNVLDIRINDYKPTAQGFTNPIDSSLRLMSYGFHEVSGSGYEVDFQGSFFNQASPVFKWDFGDGSTSSQMNPTHVYQKAGRYKVCLTVADVNGCTGYVCNEYEVGDQTCFANVYASPAGNTGIRFSAPVQGTPPYAYLWNFGDGTSSVASAPLHTYPHAGSYPVILRVIDAKGDTAYARYNAVTGTDRSSCSSNMNLIGMRAVTLPGLSKVTLGWTDAAGSKYSSGNVVQPASAYFRIREVSDYGFNEKGQRIKKLKIQFNCRMNDGLRTITVENAETVFCVAYPN